MLVGDESGSVSDLEFNQFKTFIQNFANSFTFGNDATRMGLVMYSTEARLITGLTPLRAQFNSVVQSVGQTTGSTCTGCGMALAVSQLQAFKRPDATAIIIVITDGLTNVFTETIEGAAAAADTLGYTRLAVGVGVDVAAGELDLIASDIPDVQTVFFVNGYNALVPATLIGGFFPPQTPPAALDVVVHIVVNPALTLSGAASDVGVVTRNGNEVVWTIPELQYGTSTLSFTTAAPAGPGATGLMLFSTSTYQAGSGTIAAIQSPLFDLPACDTDPPDPGIEALLAELELCQTTNQALAADLDAATAQVTTLQGEAAAAHAEVAALQTQVSSLQSQVSTLETQLAGLQSDLLAAQLALAAANGDALAKAALISGGVASIQQTLRATFNDPGFVIPGATPEDQLRNLLDALAGLNKGRMVGIYKALGGR
jgi:hypothetical protein